MLGRDPDLVGGLTGHVARGRADQVPVLRKLVHVVLDLRHGRDHVVLRGGRCPAVLRQRPLVNGVRHRVVDRERAVVDHDLGVAVLALELEPELTVVRNPQPAAGPVQNRVGPLKVRCVYQVVGELDPGGDPIDRGGAGRLVERGGERLGRRLRTAVRSGDGDRRAADDRDDQAGDDRQQTLR